MHTSIPEGLYHGLFHPSSAEHKLASVGIFVCVRVMRLDRSFGHCFLQVKGRIRQGRPVYFDGDIDLLKGKLVDVEIVETGAYFCKLSRQPFSRR